MPKPRAKSTGNPRAENGISKVLRPDRIRAATLEVLANVLEEGQLADRALSRVLRRETSLWSGERRAVAEAVYGLLRCEVPLRRALARGLEGGSLAKLPTSEVHAALLMGYQQLEGQTVDADRLSPVLRGALKSLRREMAADLVEAGTKGDASRLSLEHALPTWLAETLVAEIGVAETERLFVELNRRAPLTLRTNLLRTTREALLKELAAVGEQARATLLSPWGVALAGNPNVFALAPFRAGNFEVQDEGSQLLALLCRVRPGQIVVDACAGGGGKTLALSAEMHNRGELWALDVNARRLEEIKPRARRAGAHNVRSLLLPEHADQDATNEPQLAKLVGQAHAVLVDAPCSGVGALRRNPDARRRLTEASVREHSERQLQILRRMAPLVRPGGLLIYATCSVLRMEDEAVTEGFLELGTDFAPVSPSELLGVELFAAIEKPLAEGLRSPNGLRLWPQHHGTDGFFAAAFRRSK